jgi:hypothetical protein
VDDFREALKKIRCMSWVTCDAFLTFKNLKGAIRCVLDNAYWVVHWHRLVYVDYEYISVNTNRNSNLFSLKI